MVGKVNEEGFGTSSNLQHKNTRTYHAIKSSLLLASQTAASPSPKVEFLEMTGKARHAVVKVTTEELCLEIKCLDSIY